jgi:tetratricopeptide (TPR) repeat protein
MRALLLVSLLAGAARAQSDAELAEARRELDAAHAAQAPGEAAGHFEKAAALSHQPAILAEAGRAWQKQWESAGGLEPLRRARADYREYLKRVPVASERATVESAVKTVDEEWSKLLHGKRDELLAAASGVAAVALAEDFLAGGDLDAAEAALDRFDRGSGAGRGELARAYAARGRLAATRGDAKSAAERFVAALELEPSLPPPPELEKAGRAAFGKAQGQLRGRLPLRFAARAPRHARAGATVELGVTTEGDVAGVQRKVEVRWRIGEGEFASASGRSVASVNLPAEAERLQWYARVLGDHEALLGEVGSAAQPLTLAVEHRTVATAPSKPLWKRWQLWVGVGAAALAVIAVGTAVGVVESPPPRTGIPVMP